MTWGAPAGLGALVGGIALGERLGPSPGTFVLLGALLLAGLCSLCRSTPSRRALLLVAVALGGCALCQRALDGLVHSPLSRAVAARSEAAIEATLVDDPDGSRFTTSALARVRQFSVAGRPWRDAGGRTVLVVGEGDAGPRLGVLAAGDRVVLQGWLRPLEGFDSRLRWRHAVAGFDAVRLDDFGSPGDLLPVGANALRGTVLRGTATLPPTEGALVAGFLLGDTRALPDGVLASFRAAGLSHLLAVSGANVAFVLALMGPALRRTSRTPRLVLTLLVLLVFGAMTRWEPSVLRACAMAAVAVLAAHAGRPAHATRTLAVAAFVLLVIDPFLLHSVGFLLSCGASLGIALLSPVLAARLRGPQWLRESLATTAAAQIGVAPVLLPVFGSIPLVSLPANVVAVPLAAPLTTVGLATGCVGGLLVPVAPDIARLLQAPSHVLADAVLGIADAAGRVPLALDQRGAVALGAVVGLIALSRHPRMLRRHAPVAPPR